MNINRHNYEEFFLLYVDMELSAADRKAVDVFVKGNPDLEMELLALQQTVVTSEDIVLEKKDWLYMEEEITVLQENLLLYADDELKPADRVSVERFLETNEAARAEWAILQQLKLQPDNSIIFDDKKALYRTEDTRVVGFKWWRAAAAAILLGFGVWTGLAVYKNNFSTPGENEVSATSHSTQKNAPSVPVTAEKMTAETQSEKKIIPDDIATTDTKNSAEQKTGMNKETVEKHINQNKNTEQENMTAQANNTKRPDNNLPEPYSKNINNTESNKTVTAAVLPEIKSNRIVSGNNNTVAKTNPIEKSNTDGIVTDLNRSVTNSTLVAAVPVVNKTDENNNRYLDIEDDKGKRTALGGFLRKAKRMIERTANINTGEGIKIAGFEIALK